MNRRALLRTIGLAGVSLAGCVAPTSTETDESPSDTTLSTATDTPGATQTATDTSTVTRTASDTPTATDTPTPATHTPPPDDPIAVRLDNGGPDATVGVTVTDGQETLLAETVTLAAGESREFDTGIDTTGEYTLTVDVHDGPERTHSLTVESYDVRMGSNAIAWIREDEITIVVEE